MFPWVCILYVFSSRRPLFSSLLFSELLQYTLVAHQLKTMIVHLPHFQTHSIFWHRRRRCRRHIARITRSVKR